MACHSLRLVLWLSPRPTAGLPLLPWCHCSSFQWEQLYFHCQAMKCLCMTAEHTTINLTPAELTGQKPMQPLLGTEHYQCMDSLFIRGSIRHRSLRCHTGYERDRQQVNAGRSATRWRNRAHDMIAYTPEAIAEKLKFHVGL